MRMMLADITQNVDVARSVAEHVGLVEISGKKGKEDRKGEAQPKVGRREKEFVVAENWG